MKNPLSLPWRLGMALLFGALSILAHGPVHAWWFAPWCIAGWLLALQPGRTLQNLLLGLAFGIGWFTAGTWWIGSGLLKFTAAGPFGAVVMTLGLILYLSCFPALAGLLIGKVRTDSPGPPRWLIVAACWTVTAWLRSVVFGGLPWVSMGTGQLTGPLCAWAPVGGSLLVEFIVLVIAASLADSLCACTRSPWNRRQLTGPVLSIGFLLLASVLLKTIDWTQPAGELTVRLAQGNLPQQEKFSVAGLRHAGEVYGAAIANSHAQLTILPETAFPMTWEALPIELKLNIRRFASNHQTAVMLGALLQEPSGAITNDLLLIRPGYRPDADQTPSEAGFDDRYVKEHLVLIGEYLPRGLSWLGRRLNIAYSSLNSGVGSNHVVRVDTARIWPTICFESLFGAANALHARDANLLVNISNFAFFTGTWAADQDLDVIRMRSLEAGRWTARAANSGVTAFVDDKGTVVDALPQDVSAVLDGRVDLRAGMTPYARGGDLPIILTCGIVLLLWAATGRARSFAARDP